MPSDAISAPSGHTHPAAVGGIASQRSKEKGEKAPSTFSPVPLTDAYAARAIARSQSAEFRRTSSRIAVMRRVRVVRPDAERRVRPPAMIPS